MVADPAGLIMGPGKDRCMVTLSTGTESPARSLRGTGPHVDQVSVTVSTQPIFPT
jgi:hypothetical protein